MYTRICPNCGKEITYKTYSGWYNASKNNTFCLNCANYNKTKHDSDLSILLKDTPESYYWIGFLLADGCFKENKRISLSLALKDKQHLINFAKFIKFTGVLQENSIAYRINAQDVKIVPKIMSKFDIKSKKTYNPPTIDFTKFDKNLILSLICGFIDGDGCIKYQTKRKAFCLTIKCHSSWLNILNQFGQIIGDYGHCKINTSGYAVLNITNTKILKKLKQDALLLNIPILNRKWDKIDLNFISKYEIANDLKIKVFSEFDAGILNHTEISKKYNTSAANITRLRKKYETINI